MGELKGIYAIWYRELKVFSREKSRVISSIVSPILWLLIIGGGIGSVVSFSGIPYQTFIYPGILVQAALFSSVFFGVYIVWDRKIDFLKEVLVSPISRTSIFVGKVIGGSTDTLIETVILLIIGYFMIQAGMMPGLQLNLLSAALALIILFITTISLVSIGLIVGSQMESPEGFQLVSSFLIFPMFFLSGALYPINNLPSWLSPFIFIDPVTYSVDALRSVLLGASQFSLGLDLLVMCVFAAATIGVGTYAFGKMSV
ncbi:ABC-2 type transporter [uncultured archaeon]|nr:ABC-2 type transporter [uncultured archaeon]